ncbi:MAG: type I methionyl aminopeptidase [Andreesenia angusta]|nr:type I methionyl aminopeptidase [Andreesenia angusta]
MIILKSKREIEIMRRAGRLVGETHAFLKEKIVPGITTLELDRLAEEFIRSKGALPGFKGYRGFPGTICASVNEEVVHGIPGDRELKEGDIISIDIGTIVDNYYGDGAKTYPVGKISEEDQRLIDVTRESFYKGIEFAVEGNRLSDISHAIQKYVEENKFSVVTDFVGHGIGKNMHEDPPIPNFGPPGKGPRLQKGMVLAIEPMVNAGTRRVKALSDGWTVVTADGKKSAHYEHTIAFVDDGIVLLTEVD